MQMKTSNAVATGSCEALFAYLDEISDGDLTFRSEVAHVFLDTVEDDLEELGQGARNSEFEYVTSRAQKLTGSAVCVGAYRLASLCSEIGAGARNRNLGAVKAGIASVESEFSRVKRELTRRLNDL